MNKRLKYPEEFVPNINFETGETDMLPESKEQRQARLRRTSNARRSAAFANRYALETARWEAVTEAWRRVYDGASMPIHFDFILRSGDYTITERYTLVDAAFTHLVFDHNSIVGSKGANKINANRPRTVPADFVYEVTLG